MAEGLIVPVEDSDLSLRILSSTADDKAFLEAVRENPEHLMQYGDKTGSKYQRIEDVTNARVSAKEGTLRFGIWKDELHFLGGINATPSKKDASAIEVGYWLRESEQGHGYMTLAVRALTKYLRQQGRYNRIFAETHIDNEGSMQVLRRAGYRTDGHEVKRKWGQALVFEAFTEAVVPDS